MILDSLSWLIGSFRCAEDACGGGGGGYCCLGGFS